MAYLIIGLPFFLVAASMWRWARVAQQHGYQRGCLTATKRKLVATGSSDRIMHLVLTGCAIVGMVIWPLALVAALLWFAWPRSIPFRDPASPLVWDAGSRRFIGVAIAVLFLMYFILYVLTVVAGLYALSLMPLLAVMGAEVTLRLFASRTQTA